MSDTPRTDAWKWSGGDDPIGEFYKFACQLERELNAANERIKRLEEALDRITFYAQTGILKDSFDEIKRIAKEAKP